jgi:hypothetical protein
MGRFRLLGRFALVWSITIGLELWKSRSNNVKDWLLLTLRGTNQTRKYNYRTGTQRYKPDL